MKKGEVWHLEVEGHKLQERHSIRRQLHGVGARGTEAVGAAVRGAGGGGGQAPMSLTRRPREPGASAASGDRAMSAARHRRRSVALADEKLMQ
jgi:hypothetical protein